MQKITKRGWIIIAVATVIIISIAVMVVNATESDKKDNLAKCEQWLAAIKAGSEINLSDLEVNMCERRGYKMYNNEPTQQ